ncbi:beta-ketoacyl-[acyl-carrier-protein] synthase family protein [Desulfovibrio litoralis]|uniref:3-oxoacyl-[acyl-carrier-protein] synthase II n=1 Tax=Desulfovibrio litoralis DSM 11393 TaxID=1121455 RepID=A0A1M7SU36_9BACT|nr:beta-ketoacyl-[acyl-carrier-protein] synthase family protein [Desulfovibrio litoralis]SHN61910.1 3-oxoacyl-[acyl-carrier-protein] synthase II [Desulfovibrio litoralis DSM 11393]
MSKNIVSVAAMSCITAAGTNLADTLIGIDNNTTIPIVPTWYETSESPVFQANISFDPSILYSRTVLLLEHSVNQAFLEVSSLFEQLKDFSVGVCIGTSVGASLNFYKSYRALKENKAPLLDEVFSFSISNPALALGHIFNCTGPTTTITNACSSGTDAIGVGADWIINGLCDVVIAGGADELSEISYTGFSRLMITSPEPCKPFDKERKGLNLGEGAGIMILVSEKVIKQLKLIPKGYILGYGTCTDAHHLTTPHPETIGLKQSVNMALKSANISSEKISFINAHATATPTNDLIEGRCLKELFPNVPIVATKGSTGHTLGAAGAIEAVLTLAHLNRKQLPKTPNFFVKDPEIGISPTTESIFITGNIGLSQSLAFGGNNSVLIISGE